MKTSLRMVLSIVGAVTTLLLVAGCQSGGAGLAVEDPYVKAAPAGEMSAMFGRLVNSTGSDLTVVSAASEAAESVELHEMVMQNGAMVMQEKSGGFVIPAHGSVVLEPGGLHVMLIGLTREITPGAEVSFTLTLVDGSTLEVTAMAREMANAQESYHR